ncbi:hypothetical protein [Lederbergia galactosidilytica]|uniref:DUF4901 domain-containing protein n=1 Tax=Lederbergia galactosidilytica TaxID=217031 RepID=A0A178A5V5_9BACI|nr:hypothetical protein [Lederbergia galactosidilytica]KRG12166.1 hypothetical protein ACA30_20280 [Virgibacillus soli]MBP1917487.1 hypothetical protein [Lederbergia galactosidilytica]OAK74860.1 hypothetical protein ABB05_03465 [Lederbergia galactosidilytica]
MDKRIEELINFTREKYCLHEYYLHTFDIYRSTTIFKETVYSLSMEWFPNHINNWDDETYNPEGTVSIEIDIHSRKTKHVIFSQGISTVNGMTFDLNNRDEIIKWIEKETGLNYGRQFEFWKEEERELHFKECIDGIVVSPSGYIEFKLDKEGRLTLFSVYGQFPSEKLVKKEKYILSLEQVEELAKEQLKLIEFPVIEQKKLVPAFAIEEIYVKNDGSSTLPYEFFVDDKFPLQMDKVIEWDDQIQKPFQGKIISLIENVTPDQAFQCEPHPDLRPITEEDVKKCIHTIRKFLSQEYTNDSGKWTLKSLYRDKGYIHATLKAKEQKERVFRRKMKLFIDSETYEVLNYMDNKPFLKEYMELKEAEEIKVTKEEAFEKIKEFIELTPYYVYDFGQGYYVLCGKLDCQYAVKANNGEVVELSEL